MSKKLKKKIEELCGLKDLSWEARQDRASKILASSEWKQSLCNELVGLSFRELERTLNGVATERQKKEDSYERKLKQYKEGKIGKKPMQRDSSGTEGRSAPTTPHVPKRTLQEILEQVYAPRVVPERDPSAYDWINSVHSESISSAETKSTSVSPDTNNVPNSAKSRVG